MRTGARGRGLTPLFGYLLHRRGHKPSAWEEGVLYRPRNVVDV